MYACPPTHIHTAMNGAEGGPGPTVINFLQTCFLGKKEKKIKIGVNPDDYRPPKSGSTSCPPSMALRLSQDNSEPPAVLTRPRQGLTMSK